MKTGFCIAMMAVAASSIPAFAQGQGDQDKIAEKMCQETICQRNIRVVLKKKDGSVYDQTFPVFQPIVQDFGFALVPGQTVNIEAEISDGRLTNLRAVETIKDPSRTLTATFKQMDDGGMQLHVQNPFAQTLKFDMGIMPLDSDDLYKTSSCPINKGSYEFWPYPIFQVVLGYGRVIDHTDPKSTVCD
jgi:hypothetical protein